ncbi:MAG: type IV secretory system conjugative DNA transfer family protein [Anaerolineae bacterium]|nr:type IV secretory system conjugative DNA transfer family protein [Anaerolineae bacterium]
MSFVLPNVALTSIYVSLLSDFAVQRATTLQKPLSGLLGVLVGGPMMINQARLIIMGLALVVLLLFLNMALGQGLRRGGWLYEQVDRWRRPSNRRGEMGSAHFCTMREYRRYRREDGDGITLLGAFWGERGRRLDWGYGKFCMGAEDAARGLLTLGAPGSGKTQAVILPVIADRMNCHHSLIVVDPQGELTPYIKEIAKVTGHLVAIHDPTSATGPRFNLAQGLSNIPSANAIARVLVPSADGDNRFWADSATDLLTACLLRFANLGQIKAALTDMQALAKRLIEKPDDAALAAGSFIASVRADGKIATNVVATLGTALTGWSSEQVRQNTAASDFTAELLVTQPTVVVLTCPGAMRKVYAPYLGATLQKLMSDLDTIGEQCGGPLPAPVGVIIDEFPTLGRLDSLVESVNLVRKRRISILVGAQTKGQFHLIYGEEATKALFTGLATQIVYGGCDHDTAKFYSDASGTSTADANPDPARANLRQRPLLTSDEIVNPQYGNCMIFSRFVESNFALQIVVMAELTRFYERTDWKARLTVHRHHDTLLLERGVELTKKLIASRKPFVLLTKPSTTVPATELETIFNEASYLHTAAKMQAVPMKASSNVLQAAGVRTASLEELTKRFKIIERS